MKVLLSAYSCHPTAGSEPAVGFETLRAAAAEHEVWVLSRPKNTAALSAHLAGEAAFRIHLVPLDLSPLSLKVKRALGAVGQQWYYDRWQREAGKLASRLHHEQGFDLAHHVTFSSDWTRAGVSGCPVPFLWGPIGGGTTAPRSLLKILGWRGILVEVARLVGRGVMRLRPSYREAWRTAALVLVQNQETAALAPDGRSLSLLPHSTSVTLEAMPPVDRRGKELVVVGRLIPWKGGMLALAAFRRVRDPGATLTYLGDGPERERIARAARGWGLDDRVAFAGSIPREELLRRVASAGAMIHPAVHDESPLAVGEALTLGTPVICLERGGPPELLRQWDRSPGTAVAVQSAAATAQAIAAAVDRYLAYPPPIPSMPLTPRRSFGAALLAAYESVRQPGL